MRIRKSPEQNFGQDQSEIVRVSVPKPGEVFTPTELKFTLLRKSASKILNFSQLATEIQKPSLNIFRKYDSGYVVRDRRCDRCGLRHPSSVECGHNMVVVPKSFRAKRMFPRRKLTSSGF